MADPKGFMTTPRQEWPRRPVEERVGDWDEVYVPGALLPGEALKNLVHTTAREHGHGEIEKFGLALCARVLADHPRVTRARVEIVEQPWNRLEAGGKAQGQAFVAGTPEQRTATVTSNGQQVAVVAGLENLTIMRSSGFGPPRKGQDDGSGKQDGLQRLLVATLGAKWTYTSGDVTFGPYRLEGPEGLLWRRRATVTPRLRPRGCRSRARRGGSPPPTRSPRSRSLPRRRRAAT